MSERFAIGAQGAGFISFKEPITVSGSQDFDIPEGMICIGGNGRGYVIEEQTYTASPSLTLGTYILYVSDPVNASGDGDGVAEIDSSTYESYINGAGHSSPTRIFHGDTNSRRAFCYFSVDSSGNVISTSIRTLNSFSYEEQYDYLEKMGFFIFGKTDEDFKYRGQYWDERSNLAEEAAGLVTRASWETTLGVTSGQLVYKENYPAWATGTAYAVGDKIVETDATYLGLYEYAHREWEVVTGGTSHATTEPIWTGGTLIGDTITDNGVLWSLSGQAYGYFDVALADNATYLDREIVVGVVDEDRNGLGEGDNYVITSGLVDLGETVLPNTEFPTGTYLYLTDETTHITTNRPSVQTSGASPSSFIAKGNIVRDIDYWMNGKTYSVGDLILDDNEYVWRCTTGGVADGQSGLVPDFAGAGGGSPTIYEYTDAGYVGDTVSEDTIVVWVCEGEYNQQDFKGRKVRVGVSLGYGKMLFQTGAGGSANIDDHDESAMAHSDIQDALNKAGIYVYNQSQGVTDFEYRGQTFDERANFDAGVSDYDLVYLKSDGKYYKAINDVTDLPAGGVVGMAFDVDTAEGFVLSHGFIKYDTSSWSDGDTIYLHKSTAGAMTNTLTTGELDNIPVGKVIKSATDVLGGYIHLNVSPNSGVSLDYIDYSVHTAQTTNGVIDFNFVYRDPTTPDYRPALNTLTSSLTRDVVGLAYSLSSNTADIITQGYVGFDFTDSNLFDGSALAVGETLYLSSDTAGACTNIPKSYGDIKVGTCITDGAAGILYLDIEFLQDITVHEAQTTSGVSDYNIVYRNTAGNYQQALNTLTAPETRLAAGVAYNLVSDTADIVTQGYIDFDFTDPTLFDGTGLAAGDTIYLSSSTAGACTNVPKSFGDVKIGTCITVGVGVLYVDIDTSSTPIVHEAQTTSGVSDYDFVYINVAGNYQQALNDQKELTSRNVVGLAYNLVANTADIITQGFVDYDFTAHCDTVPTVGQTIYLSTSTAGNTTSTKASIDNVIVGRCIVAGANGTLEIDIDIQEDNTVDSNAAFEASFTNSDIAFVYRNSSSEYDYAVNDLTDLPAGNVIGLSHNVDTNEGAVITQGFADFTTTAGSNTYLLEDLVVGDRLYLSSTAGAVTKYRQQTHNIALGTCVDTNRIYLNIQSESEYNDNAIDYSAIFDSNVDQYDVVYILDYAGSEYNQAIVDSTDKEYVCGVAVEVDSLEGIVVTQGYVDMGDTSTGSGSNAGTLRYLVDNTHVVIGDKVYLSIDTEGVLSADETMVELGIYVGTRSISGATHYFMLLNPKSNRGFGDAYIEDLTYNELLNSHTSLFSKAYYDIFSTSTSLTAGDATYSHSKYTGTIGEYVQRAIFTRPSNPWGTATGYVLDDEIYEGDFVWKCITAGTSGASEPDWVNKVDDTNLVAHYTMESVSGSTLTDETSNGYDGTITGATEDTTSYKIGTTSLSYATGNDYTTLDSSIITDLGGATATDITVSMWFRADATSNDDGLFYIGAFNGADGNFQISIASDTLVYEVGGSSIGTPPTFTDTSEKYHHLVALFDGGNTIATLYLDGVATTATSTGASANINLSGSAILGAFYNTSTYSLNGNIDQVRIYNQILTDYEIRTLYREESLTVGVGTVIEDDDSLVWEATRSDTQYRFLVHKEDLYDPLITAEYSMDASPSTWYPIPKFDEVVYESGGFTDLHVRLTWGGSGVLSSFGVLYEYDNTNYSTTTKLNETYTQSGSGLIGDIVTVPSAKTYTKDGDSLLVFTGSGLKLVRGVHYEEVSQTTIEMLYALNDGDTLTFFEYFGALDNSVENSQRMDIRHDTTGYLSRSRTYVSGATYTLLITDDIVICDPSGANVFTLPLVSYLGAREFNIINISSTYDVVLTPSGTDTINGAASFTLTGGSRESVLIATDVTNEDWLLLAQV